MFTGHLLHAECKEETSAEGFLHPRTDEIMRYKEGHYVGQITGETPEIWSHLSFCSWHPSLLHRQKGQKIIFLCRTEKGVHSMTDSVL